MRPSHHIEIITAPSAAFIGDENASLRSRLPLKERSGIMHRHFKLTEPLQDRVASFAREVRVKASRLPPGKKKASSGEPGWPTWLLSWTIGLTPPDLQPPK